VTSELIITCNFLISLLVPPGPVGMPSGTLRVP
jgi:hypothetical protein